MARFPAVAGFGRAQQLGLLGREVVDLPEQLLLLAGKFSRHGLVHPGYGTFRQEQFFVVVVGNDVVAVRHLLDGVLLEVARPTFVAPATVGQKLEAAAAVAAVGVDPGTGASTRLDARHAVRKLQTLAEAFAAAAASPVHPVEVELALNFAPGKKPLRSYFEIPLLCRCSLCSRGLDLVKLTC